MELSKEEFDVLWAIEDGAGTLEQAFVSTCMDLEEIKKIFEKLETLEIITITKTFDSYYNKEFWTAQSTEKAKDIFKKYQAWIPKI